MKPITFTIHGNQENPHGNPIPFQRAISHMMRKASVRYLDWQSFVRNEYQREMTYHGLPIVVSDALEAGKEKNPVKTKLAFARGILKPIHLTHTKARMDIKIFWANNAHGDPDNVFKGIADALFEQDKKLAGSFDFEMATDKKGKVEVTITFNP